MPKAYKCLVTGGAGFIGSHIVDALLTEGHLAVVLDNFSSGSRANLPNDVVVYKQDINDNLDELFETEKPDTVFHHAAQISVSVSVKEPEKDTKDNVLGIVHLLEACRRHGVKKVIYASSGAAYGEPKNLPLRESDPPAPLSPYGISKYIGEPYLYYYRHQFGIEYAALRYANVFGPRQDPHGEAGVVAIFSQRLLANEQVTIYGDGEQTRDFVYVKDVARANLAALHADLQNHPSPVFNVSTQKQTTVNQLYQTMKSAAASSLEPQYGEKRGGDVLHACLANEKIREAFNWHPQTSLEHGIEETVAYFRQKAQG